MRAVLRIRAEPHYRRAAFENGLRRVGFSITELRAPNGPEDWLVLWNRQGGGEVEADAWEARGGTVIVAENGYLQKVDKTHYAISVHGHNGSGWFPIGSEDRFTKLGFTLKEWQRDDTPGYALVCGQRGIGSALMRSPQAWAEKTVEKLKRRGIVTRLRQHPGNFAPRVPLIDDLRGAASCHVWSSAAGVMALVEGIPVYHSAPHWIGEGAGPFTRDTVLERVGHGQWHHEEIATGLPFARIIEYRKFAKW